MRTQQESIDLAESYLREELDNSIIEMGLQDPRDMLAEMIDAHTELDGDAIDCITARYISTVSLAVREAANTAFESALVSARQCLLDDLAQTSKVKRHE